MKKYHIHTTLSPRHYALLKKHTEKNETQQKTLELALETLENSPNQGPAQTIQEKLWMANANVEAACLIQKDCLKLLIGTVDFDLYKKYVAEEKPVQYVIEFFYQKPLTDCSLKEILDGVIITTSMSHWFDTTDYKDEGDHYVLKITHSLGLNNSRMMDLGIKSMLTSYGVKTESKISEKTIFMKIFKDQ